MWNSVTENDTLSLLHSPILSSVHLPLRFSPSLASTLAPIPSLSFPASCSRCVSAFQHRSGCTLSPADSCWPLKAQRCNCPCYHFQHRTAPRLDRSDFSFQEEREIRGVERCKYVCKLCHVRGSSHSIKGEPLKSEQQRRERAEVEIVAWEERRQQLKDGDDDNIWQKVTLKNIPTQQGCWQLLLHYDRGSHTISF